MKLLSLFAVAYFTAPLAAQTPAVPEALKPWGAWALRNDQETHSPAQYTDAAKRLPLWPSALKLEAGAAGGKFGLSVQAFDEAWLTLPGGSDVWPQEVMVDGQAAPVLERDDRPAIRLQPGMHTIGGVLRWKEMPERIPVPPQTGILNLTIDGAPVDGPDWEPDGTLWLRRTRAEAADRDFLSLQVYRVLEDGIPMFLRTEIELSVAGKSREEELGTVLPEGWLLSSIETPVPCAVDDAGRMKVQVRAGKWTVQLTAFRTAQADTFRYAEGARPLIDSELIALKSEPSLRVIELRGITSIDVSQTTFPEKWRRLPVHLWDTKVPFQIEEKMRGMGHERPPGLKFEREFWLDEAGGAVTYRDRLTGSAQRTWRLDAAAGHDLGAVKIDGDGQLITLNPATQAHGVEVRTRELHLEATGRVPFTGQVAATGWTSSAESLKGTLHLPPGWRLLAIMGPEYSRGDWLTAWTLLDVFLVLVFSLAVYRLWGRMAALLALIAMILTWQEPGAPKWTLFMVVAAMALIRVLPAAGRAARWGMGAMGLSLIALAAVALPFVSDQVTGMLFPQVERVREARSLFAGDVSMSRASMAEYAVDRDSASEVMPGGGGGAEGEQVLRSKVLRSNILRSNLVYDKKAQIQTGPALPEWEWRTVEFGWNGPVGAKQTMHPIFLPSWVQRLLVAVRLALFAALGWAMWRRRRGKPDKSPGIPAGGNLSAAAATLVAGVMLAVSAGGAFAQEPAAAAVPPAVPPAASLPSKELLEQLREQLLKPPAAFPRAAEIPSVKLALKDRELTMEILIHTGALTAVPLPGKLPAWAPVSVEANGQPAAALGRRDGYLWIALTAGTHRVIVRGMVPSSTEWQWTFELRPRLVEIDAPGWVVTGVKPNGVPEAQVFFARQQAAVDAGAAYDRRDFNAVVTVDRHLELGLVWQVRTKVSRLSATGKALSFSLPLLPGERILTGEVVPAGGRVEVRLGSGDEAFSWESELPVQPAVNLVAEKTDRWIERWHLETSPVWNVSLTGLSPVFSPDESALIPSWHPWPGETATLTVSRPEPVAGETTTVSQAVRVISLAAQRRSSTLTLDLEASVGRDFPVTLPAESDVTALKTGGQITPVRREGGEVIVPVRPGRQQIIIDWTEPAGLPLNAAAGPVILPVESSNITTTMKMPENRWILWARGPLNGPAVRFWAVLAAAMIFAQILGRLPGSPLTILQWTFLLPGLTQVPLIGGGGLVAWLFWLAWRGKSGEHLPRPLFNINQVLLAGGALCAAGVIVLMVHTGLLGRPTMYILGQGSWRNTLQWYQDRAGTALPVTEVVSVSIWVYRGLMLAWCLWLAFTLLWLVRWAWTQFSAAGLWRKHQAAPSTPPPPAPPP